MISAQNDLQAPTVDAIIALACQKPQVDDTLIDEVLEILRLYTDNSPGTLDNLVYNFATSFLGNLSLKENVKLLPGEGTKGLSGAPVYLVYQSSPENHILQAVIKVFPGSKKAHTEFVRELRAIPTLAKLNLALSRHVDILGLGKCLYRGQTCALLLQSAAQGRGVDDWLEGYLRGTVTADQAELIIQATAKAFAELHRQTSSGPPSQLDEYIAAIRDMVPKVIEKNGLENFCNNITTLLETAKTDPGSGAVIHGDGHPGNIFADIGKDNACTITFIDTPSLDKTWHFNGDVIKGFAPPERDFSNFLIRANDICIRKTKDPSHFKDFRKNFRIAYDFGHLVKTQKTLQKVRSLLGTICKYQTTLNEISLENEEYYQEKKAMEMTMIITVGLLQKILKKRQTCENDTEAATPAGASHPLVLNEPTTFEEVLRLNFTPNLAESSANFVTALQTVESADARGITLTS